MVAFVFNPQGYLIEPPLAAIRAASLMRYLSISFAQLNLAHFSWQNCSNSVSLDEFSCLATDFWTEVWAVTVITTFTYIYIYKMWDAFIIELNLCNEGLLLKLCALVFRSQDLSTVQKQGGVSPETEACLGYVRFETSTWIHFSCTISAQVWSI